MSTFLFRWTRCVDQISAPLVIEVWPLPEEPLRVSGKRGLEDTVKHIGLEILYYHYYSQLKWTDIPKTFGQNAQLH